MFPAARRKDLTFCAISFCTWLESISNEKNLCDSNCIDNACCLRADTNCNSFPAEYTRTNEDRNAISHRYCDFYNHSD